jgi:hypothetical protein
MSLRRADPSSRGVLPSVVCLCVSSKPQQWGGLGPSRAVALQKKKWKPAHENDWLKVECAGFSSRLGQRFSSSERPNWIKREYRYSQISWWKIRYLKTIRTFWIQNRAFCNKTKKKQGPRDVLHLGNNPLVCTHCKWNFVRRVSSLPALATTPFILQVNIIFTRYSMASLAMIPQTTRFIH